STYGFVCRSDYFASGIRTATHELGHCFNLYHTFESYLNSGSNGCGDNCSTSGDLVCDTPPAAEATWDCNPFQNSCNNDQNGSAFTSNMPDQIENYMSYDQGCQNMFTIGQKDRMDASFDNYAFLQQLTSSANALATGVNSPSPQVCVPKASFTTFNNRYICEGNLVEFKDFSYEAYPDSTWTWNWSFPGGTPSSSTDQNPVVAYNSAGVYNASLTVTSSVGTSTFSRPSYITVKSIEGITAPFTQGIEDSSFPVIDPSNVSKNWTIVSNLTNTWHRVTNAGSQGSSSSLRINNAVIPVTTTNELISPSLDLTSLPSAKLTFDMAYAKRESTSTDQLKIYFSTDCGLTWVMRYIKTGDGLVSNDGSLVPGFVPSATDWKNVSVTIAPSYLVNNLKIKFEMESGQGNALYLDNINIGGLVNTEEKLNSSSFVIYPNPAKDAVIIKVDSRNSTGKVNFQFTDVLGREVIKTITTAHVSGHVEVPVSLKGISAGVYFVRVSD
ncbi:MAG: T9SS type A sorting domain-containing protein, partial [Sphingobacteriales bacterium]